MPDVTSLGEVFRFVQLRPPRPADDVPVVDLLWTALVKALAAAPTAERRTEIAAEALDDDEITITDMSDLALGEMMLDALREVLGTDDPSTVDVVDELGDPDDIADRDEFAADRRRLSDTIVASRYAPAGGGRDLATLANVFRVYHLVAAAAAGSAIDEPVADYLRRTLRSPLGPPRRPARDEYVAHEAHRGHDDDGNDRAANERDRDDGDDDAAHSGRQLHAAIEELAGLDVGAHVVQPNDDGTVGADPPVFTLTAAARDHLSAGTIAVVDRYAIDLAATPVHTTVALLEDLVRGDLGRSDEPAGAGTQLDRAGRGDVPAAGPAAGRLPRRELFPGGPPSVRSAGVAQLLVVKEHIKRYEAGEIAHVETVLAGETRSRTHRRLERTEETFTTETETTVEQEHELETAERFELNRETSRTIERDLRVGFGLSLSGKYGPTVEFSSNAEMELEQSVQESVSNATTYSRDVVQRSLERIAERVREERVRRIVRETEETNLHELMNDSEVHRNGVYQFLDKVSEAQVFDYGVREMFDFMIPEPASFLWHVDSTPRAAPRLPDPPEPLENYVASATGINPLNYQRIAARYGATDVQAPPPRYRTVTATIVHGEDDADEEGQPRSQATLDLSLPDGYRPWRATVNGLAVTDHIPVVAVTVGGRTLRWQPGPGDRIDLSGGFELAWRPQLAAGFDTSTFALAADAKLTVGVVAFETNTWSLNCTVTCRRTAEHMDAWRNATYAIIHAAHQDRVQEHRQLVADLEAQAEADARDSEAAARFGQAPSQNRRTIRAELKKHCISVVTRQRYEAFDATQHGDPPVFDFDEAAAEGAFIRFFEQAFEWDQMQWVFYPYFWARAETWVDRFTRTDVDPEFREFWMAGAARVVVPARRGFEPALNHYLETGQLWNGQGDPPDVSSPLYVSIVQEIKERTGADADELPVGEPWDVRVPTSLVLVRLTEDLPSWRRVAPDTWEWLPEDPEPADDPQPAEDLEPPGDEL